jgi:CubicO group peptidase (beta-lactamase class C family)
VSRNRIRTWLLLIVVGLAMLPVAILGLFAFMAATATPLHPDEQSVPATALAAPSTTWSAAVERGRQSMRAVVAERNLPGLSVAVGAGDDIVWAEGFGWADTENRTPVSPSTRFRIGTASIVLTSAAVGLLVERGRLKLDDEIQTYVPDFPKKQWPVTLRQLMGHVAGVRNDGGDEGPLFAQHCERPGDALQFFADSPLLFEPGTEYRYSSYGWILMSAAVEAAADEPFLAFMRTQVFEPLGMNDTKADAGAEPIPNQAISYFPRFAADPRYGPDLMRDIDLSCYAGASAFLSTPSDLVRFGLAMNGSLRQGSGADGRKLLQASTVRLFQTPQRLRSGTETGYGLGWDLETATLAGEQVRVVGHDGDVLGGMAASLLMLPERSLVVAVMSNTSYADTYSVGLKIAEAFR